MKAGLPVVLDVADRHCVVVGAGAGGRRKLAALLAAGARVTVIDPAGLSDTDAGASTDGDAVTVLARRWEPGDGAEARVVVAATDDQAVNEAVAAEARTQGALVLRADRPAEGDVRLAAVTRRQALSVAVDSGGGSPAFAAVVRDEIARLLATEGERWDELGRWAAEHRPVSVAELEARLAEMRGMS